MRIKTVLFDWNGTIMDDLDIGFNACNHMLRYYGIPTISKERFQETFNTPWFIFYERNGVTREMIDLTKHSKEFMKVYYSLSKKAKPRKNVRKVFEWLKNNGILIGIVSYHIKEDIEKNLKKHGLNKFFDVIIGEETDVETGTTENKKIKSALSRLKMPKNEVIYVGDTSHDITLSKKEGLLTVGIANGWQSKDILTKAEPDYLIKNMEELIDIVKNINGWDYDNKR